MFFIVFGVFGLKYTVPNISNLKFCNTLLGLDLSIYKVWFSHVNGNSGMFTEMC